MSSSFTATPSNTIAPAILTEFRQSAIPDHITAESVITGKQAVDDFLDVHGNAVAWVQSEKDG